MPRSGCSALHGVNPNWKKKKKKKILWKSGQTFHVNVIDAVKVTETHYVHVKKCNLIVIILRLIILIVNNIYHMYKWEGAHTWSVEKTVFIFILYQFFLNFIIFKSIWKSYCYFICYYYLVCTFLGNCHLKSTRPLKC